MGKTPAERVRDTVRYNTGGPQLNAIADHHVRVILVGNGPLTVDEFEAGSRRRSTKDGSSGPIEAD